MVQLCYRLFEGKKPQSPLFLVLCGPPGSGKTHIVGKVLRHYFSRLENYALIVVDNMLRQIHSYRSAMDALLRSRDAISIAEFYAQSQKIYAKHKLIVETFKAMLLDIALKRRLNVVYETTGSNKKSLRSLIRTVTHARSIGYHIQVVFPYVTRANLLQRVELRNQKIGRAIPYDLVAAMEHDSKRNFVGEFLPHVDTAYVYDNNLPMAAPLQSLFSKIPRQSWDDDDDDAEEPRHLDGDEHRAAGASPPVSSSTATHDYLCDAAIEAYPDLLVVLQPFCNKTV
jgi:predicted ABC-type ATPase